LSGPLAQPLRRAWRAGLALAKLERPLDDIRINQGRMLAAMNASRQGTHLSDYEFRVFSQWGEDGIIQFLVGELDIPNRCFIEFGVEDFSESNCRFLLMKDRWAGFVIDGSPDNIARLRSSYYFWQYPIECVASFVTRENIVGLLEKSGFGPEPGILSIDIDGVDYFVLEALEHLRPAILIVEYNGVFGRGRAVSVPYDAAFVRGRKHHSNLYYGANLPAFMHLASARGYALVGVNGAGSNAFFVRRELLRGRVREATLDSCYRDSTFREGRDASGELDFASGAARRRDIAHLPLLDVVTNETLTVGDLGPDPT
jgi:hypothetical protein